MPEKKRTPDWALDPFERLLDHVEGAAQLLELSMRGISVLRAMPQALQAIAEAKPPSDAADHQAQLDRAQQQAQLAQSEVDAGFPLLHAQATISLWGDLENALRTFVATWLSNEPTARNIESVQRLKVCLGEYESMDPDERCYYIVDRLEQDLASRNRRGVDRFESLLQPFGFAGPLDKQLKRDLLELYHVRNVLVHRRGLADRKLVQACPWLHLTQGKQITIAHECYLKYHKAVTAYVLEVIVRVAGRFGFTRSELIHEPRSPAQPS
jgi:hypothetical protein